MSNTAVLFQALQQQPPQLRTKHVATSTTTGNRSSAISPSSYNNSTTTTTSSSSSSSSNMPMNRRYSAAKRTSDTNIRRGAEIVRQQLSSSSSPIRNSKQQQVKLSSLSSLVLPSSLYRMEPKNNSSNIISNHRHRHSYGSSSRNNNNHMTNTSYDADEYNDDDEDGHEVTTEDDVNIPSVAVAVSPQALPQLQLPSSINNNNLENDNDENEEHEDHLSVTSWSQYDINSYHKSNNLYPSTNTIEIDPPSVADWSIDDQIHDDDDDNLSSASSVYDRNHYATTKIMIENQPKSLLLAEPLFDNSVGDDDDNNNDIDDATEDEEQYRQSRNNILLQHQQEEIAAATAAGGVRNTSTGFISSDGDDCDEEEDDANKGENDNHSNNDNNNDANDSDDDIVSVLPTTVEAISRTSSIPPPPTTPSDSTKFFLNHHLHHNKHTDPVFDLPPNTIPATSSGSSSDSAEYYRHRTVPISPKSKKKNWSSYPIPYEPTAVKTTSKYNPTSKGGAIGKGENNPSFLSNYDIGAYCGYNNGTKNNHHHFTQDDDYNDDDNGDVSSPPPIREIPIQNTPNTTISNLTTPNRSGSNSNNNHRGSSRYTKQQTSKIMQQYDTLLADPAYVHALNAGYIWQSIVGQHIRFPLSWWDGARGPPITNSKNNNMTNNHYNGGCDTMSDSNIPWMYFGRHTIKNHPILNQLVKCRASAGRLLLHIVVQDLMTRTPIQDIVIGCFHPNSKHIRPSNSPALKKLEDCRDVYMAVRKRSHSSVAATDTLLYSPSNWENNYHNDNDNMNHPSSYINTTTAIRNSRMHNNNNKSTYQYSISRSPLGSGQRVNNQNVRAVFGDKAPLETIFLSEDELYERLMNKITLAQQQQKDSKNSTNTDISPPLAILQDLVFA